MYRLYSKLVCFAEPANETESSKNTSLLYSMSIFRTLRICNVLLFWHQGTIL